jgi:hypothetical protein
VGRGVAVGSETRLEIASELQPLTRSISPRLLRKTRRGIFELAMVKIISSGASAVKLSPQF